MKITIIDYGMGNLSSVKNAIEHLNGNALITQDPGQVRTADAIILPGVGAFGEAMENLKRLGLVDALNRRVVEEKKPFLGICLGMQLVAKNSEENGLHQGLGWIDGEVRRIRAANSFRLPHIGWNDIHVHREAPLYRGLGQDRNFYFVHSYHLRCSPEWIAATCDYGETVTASVQKENIFAAQFHPEKSHANGLLVLKNFLDFVQTC